MRDVDALVARYNNLLKTGAAYAAGELRGAPTSTFEIYIGHFRDIGKEIADALESERSRADRLEKALTRCQHALAMLIDPNNERFNVSIQHAWAQCVEAETTARTALGKEDVSD